MTTINKTSSPHLFKHVSLLSTSDVRYDGRLYIIDHDAKTIALHHGIYFYFCFLFLENLIFAEFGKLRKIEKMWFAVNLFLFFGVCYYSSLFGDRRKKKR